MTYATESTNLDLLVERPSRRRGRPRREPVFESIHTDVIREFKMVDKSKLVIPTDDYQRNEAEGKIAKEIAMHFDLVAFGALIVIDSVTGNLLVADGGTRLSAARLRGDILEVPCMVYSGLTREEEADSFLRINENRRRLQVEQLQHAELFAKRDLAVTTEAYLQSLREARVGFYSLGLIRRCVRAHNEATSTVVYILTQAAVDKQVTARVFNGLVTLEFLLRKEDRTLNKRPTINRLASNFGHLDHAVGASVTTQKRTDRTTLAAAVAYTLHIRMPKGK